jgi:hypothetical protein
MGYHFREHRSQTSHARGRRRLDHGGRTVGFIEPDPIPDSPDHIPVRVHPTRSPGKPSVRASISVPAHVHRLFFLETPKSCSLGISAPHNPTLFFPLPTPNRNLLPTQADERILQVQAGSGRQRLRGGSQIQSSSSSCPATHPRHSLRRFFQVIPQSSLAVLPSKSLASDDDVGLRNAAAEFGVVCLRCVLAGLRLRVGDLDLDFWGVDADSVCL